MKTLKKLQKQKKNNSHKSETSQRLLDHLNELRSRVLACILFFLFSSIIGFFLRDKLFEFLIKPFSQPLFYTSPAGGLNFIISVSIFFGLALSIPFFIYQLVMFIEPAFEYRLRSKILLILFSSCILAILGMIFAYFISLPAALHFLSLLGTNRINSLITADSYLSFFSRYVLGFGFLFQLPLIMLLINELFLLSFKKMMRYQKWVILVSFIIAAILTPTPDFVNQTIMALPIILLYQLSIVLILLVNKSPRK